MARSVVKTVFEFEVPVQRKRPKTCKNRSFNGLALICVVFGPYLLAGIVNSKTVFTTVAILLVNFFLCSIVGQKIFKSKRGGPIGVGFNSSFLQMTIHMSEHKNLGWPCLLRNFFIV